MKNNRGFTLIELLAIIVILAIIAFITVPRIMDFTASARKGAAKTSAMEYADAVEKTSLSFFVESGGRSYSGLECVPVEIAVNVIQVKGKVPTDGWFCVKGESVISYSFVIDDAYVVTSFDMNEEPTVEEGNEPAEMPESPLFPIKPPTQGYK